MTQVHLFTRGFVLLLIGIGLFLWVMMLLQRPRTFIWEGVALHQKPEIYHHGNVRVGYAYPVWSHEHELIQPIAILDKVGNNLEVGVFPLGQYRSPNRLSLSTISFRGWVREIHSDVLVTEESLHLEPWVSNPSWQPSSLS